MMVRRWLIVSLTLAAAMAGFAGIASAMLPPGTRLPVHWNFAGAADQTAPALRALLVPPVLVAVCATGFALIPRLEPMQDRLEASAPVLRAAWGGMLMVLVLTQLAIAAAGWGMAAPVRLVMAGLGMLLLLLGDALPKSRPGFFVGVRTPWAIMDTDNWIATHRLAGRLMMVAGAAVLLDALVTASIPAMGAVLLVGYSWWLWHRDTPSRGAR